MQIAITQDLGDFGFLSERGPGISDKLPRRFESVFARLDEVVVIDNRATSSPFLVRDSNLKSLLAVREKKDRWLDMIDHSGNAEPRKSKNVTDSSLDSLQINENR